MKIKTQSTVPRVLKSNRLIEAKYKLSLNEQRFILLAISKIKQHDSVQTHTFHIKEFAVALGLEQRNAYETLRQITKSILDRNSLYLCPDPDTEIQCNWFSQIKYKRTRATIQFEFASGLIPYLFDLKEKFTTYKLKTVLRLSSMYSVRIYELLKKDEWLGDNEFSVDDLKEMLGVSEHYKLYGDFKKKVLEPARKELSSKADIFFNYKEIKKGKKVIRLSFKISRRTNRGGV